MTADAAYPTPARDAAGRWFARDGETRYLAELRGKPLTDREREVLDLVARGRTNAEIGGDLGISQHTTKSHMTHILAKLNVADRAAAAVQYALDTDGVRHATALIDATERLLLIVRHDIDTALLGIRHDVDEALGFVRKARGEIERPAGRQH